MTIPGLHVRRGTAAEVPLLIQRREEHPGLLYLFDYCGTSSIPDPNGYLFIH